MSQKNPAQKLENRNNSLFQSRWSYLIVLLALIIAGCIYYFPSLQDRSISAHDYLQGISMSNELVEYHKATGEYANWAANSFSGMPSFQIWKSHNNISSWITDGLYYLTNPYVYIALLISISSIILFSAMGVHPIIALLGGLTLMFSNFTIISLMAGHNNKVMVMSIVPMTLGGIWFLYERKKYLLGLFIIALSVSLQIRMNHVQITYFMVFLVGFWTLYKIFESIQQKNYKHLLLSLSIILVGVSIGAINNSSQLLTTKEYSEETQRGGPTEVEVSKNPNQKPSDGVGYDYATAWSYGILETMTLVIPNFSGGPQKIQDIDEDHPIAQALIGQGVPAQNALSLAGQLPTYWGSQPFVAGTTYISAILIYLMILGMFILKDRKKWWLLASFVFTLFIAWGDNFSFLYHLLFDYLPYFNKFRTPSMVFYLSTIIVSITAVLTLQYIVQNKSERDLIWNKFLKVSIGCTAIILILALFGPYLFSFTTPTDDNLRAQLLQMTQNNSQMSNIIFDALIKTRQSMMRMDAFRSFILIALAAGLIALFIKRKINAEVMLIITTVLVLIDIVGVDRRYVNHQSFTENYSAGIDGPVATPADRFILQDTASSYRVLDLTVNSFNESKPSYFHKNIGGYHSVKLKRYQDIISYQIQNNLQQLSQGNAAGAQVLNMLNTKYLITSPEANGVYKNEYAYGNAWLVNHVKVLNGPVEVFDQLMNEDLRHTALLEKPSDNIQSNVELQVDSNAYIQLVKFSNDELIYSYSSSHPSYAVFSEVYYNSGKGWSAFIDDKMIPQDQVNYVLRGLSLPAGKHTISFKFDTPTLTKTKKMDFASSILIILIGLTSIFIPFIQRKRNEKMGSN